MRRSGSFWEWTSAAKAAFCLRAFTARLKPSPFKTGLDLKLRTRGRRSGVRLSMQIARKSVLLLLRGYKWVLSPMLPPSCRYVPTCSVYAMEAVERYGAVRGGWMAMMRILRCHPFVKGGYDPVTRRDALKL